MAEETGREVLLPDARNHGRSPHSQAHDYQHLAADLRHFLVTRDLRDVTVIGHSMGARTAMLLCLTDPERVRDGFAVDATPIHSTPAYGVRTLKEYFRALKQIDLSTLDFQSQTLSQARKDLDRRLQEFQYFASVTRQWMLLNLERDEERRRFRWKVNLEALSDALERHLLIVPEKEHWTPFQGEFMFIGADLSGYIPRDCHAAVRSAAFPKARFAYVLDAGHYIHIDQREHFLRIILPELRMGQGDQHHLP